MTYKKVSPLRLLIFKYSFTTERALVQYPFPASKIQTLEKYHLRFAIFVMLTSIVAHLSSFRYSPKEIFESVSQGSPVSHTRVFERNQLLIDDIRSSRFNVTRVRSSFSTIGESCVCPFLRFLEHRAIFYIVKLK